MMIDNAKIFKWDFKTKDKFGKSGLQIAKYLGYNDIVDTIERKKSKIITHRGRSYIFEF